MARKKLLHIKSASIDNGAPKLPTANQIEYGEIAVNYRDGVETLSIKNSADEIITFTNDERLLAYIDGQDKYAVDDTMTKSEPDEQGVYTLGVKIDDALDLTSKYPVSNSAISTVIKEDEEVVAAALNDLNARLGSVSGDLATFETLTDELVEDLDYLSGQIDTNTASIAGLGQSKQDKLTAGTGINITENVISCTLDTQISEFVSELPTTGNTNKIYFVPNADTGATSGNTYVEYAWRVTGETQAEGEWEKLGEWTPSLTIDEELDLDSTNPVQNAAISSAMTRIELVTSSSLNDLNAKTAEISGDVLTISSDVETLKTRVANTYTKPEIDAMVDDLEITIDEVMNSGSTNPLANSAITMNFDRVEKVTASALNELNNKALELSADTTSLKATVSGIQDEIDSLSPEYVVNGKTGTTDNPIWLGASDIKLSGYTSPTNNTDSDPILSGDTVNQAFSKVISAITDNEEVTSAALNDLDARITTVSGDLQTVSGDLQTLIDNPVEPMVAVTYSELVALKSGGELAAGSWYRITDYQCTTTQTDTSAATHNFDIIVLALSNNTLSEEARAIQHDGDTYFANSKLNAWKVWYCLENDTNRFLWADTTNGKGVIYRMIDEWENDCAYDFKNILFQRKLTNGNYDTGGTNTWCYTFNAVSHNSDNETYGTCEDASLIHGLYNDGGENECVKNVIPLLYSTMASDGGGIDGQAILNDNVFLGIYEKTDDWSSYGLFACYNVFGICSKKNTFSSQFSNNTFGSYCNGNVIGRDCVRNTIGNGFEQNKISSTFYNNTIGNDCCQNTIGNYFRCNTIGNDCCQNTIGNYFRCNTIGNHFFYNTIGTGTGSTATTINYVRYIGIEDGVEYVNITTTATTSSNAYLQNIVISRGIAGTSSNRKTITHPTVGDTFQTIYRPANSQIVSV